MTTVKLLFTGLNLKTVTSSMIIQYILIKLDQYFTLKSIVWPILRSIARQPLIKGIKLVVAGRLTRKERAILFIRGGQYITLSRKSLRIDYAAKNYIGHFASVGLKIHLVHERTKFTPLYYIFRFLNSEAEEKQRGKIFLQKRTMYSISKKMAETNISQKSPKVFIPVRNMHKLGSNPNIVNIANQINANKFATILRNFAYISGRLNKPMKLTDKGAARTHIKEVDPTHMIFLETDKKGAKQVVVVATHNGSLPVVKKVSKRDYAAQPKPQYLLGIFPNEYNEKDLGNFEKDTAEFLKRERPNLTEAAIITAEKYKNELEDKFDDEEKNGKNK